MGCSTAYYLTRHPSYDPTIHRITLIEATAIAGGASGKAGGLLALWAYPSCIVPLSFRLHAELADEHNGPERWGYRGIHCGQLAANGRPKPAARNVNAKELGADEHLAAPAQRSPATLGTLRAAGVPEDLDWCVAETIMAYEAMGDPATTAQVHPYQFTMSMAELARSKGLAIVHGSVSQINYGSGAVESISYVDKSTGRMETINAAVAVLAAGPWTRSIFPSAPISALRAHSVTIRPTRPVSAYALFTEIGLSADYYSGGSDAKGKRKAGSLRTVSPEIYARPNNEVYACGEGDTLVAVPASTDLVQVDETRCQNIIDYVSSISDELRYGEVTARQACYLPNVTGPTSGPLIGETGIGGLLMATGHTCWGIQNAPATGKLISELVFDGRFISANIASLDPRHVL